MSNNANKISIMVVFLIFLISLNYAQAQDMLIQLQDKYIVYKKNEYKLRAG